MHLQPSDIETYLTKALHTRHQVVDVVQLHGGAQKVVYRALCDDGFTCILYVWDWSANYVLGGAPKNESRSHALGESYGSELFKYNQQYLEKLGVRVPRVFYLDDSKSQYPFDFALVEDVGNVDLSEYIEAHPESKQYVLEQLSALIQKMHSHKSCHYGQLNTVDTVAKPQVPCERVVLTETLHDLDYLEQHEPKIAENKQRLLNVLHDLYASILPRNEYGLIHGELGPDHVRVDLSGQPILIDIEGAKFFDIEYEHSFLDFRFGDNYRYLRMDHLDPHRLRFYKLHLHLSYTSGPLQIIQRGFPDIEGMRAIARFNLDSALRFLN